MNPISIQSFILKNIGKIADNRRRTKLNGQSFHHGHWEKIMKTILLILSAFIFTTSAWGNGLSQSDPVVANCSTQAKYDALKSIFSEEKESELNYPGSTIPCQTLTKKNLHEFYNGTQRSENPKHKWENILAMECRVECEALAKITVPQSNLQEHTKLSECVKKNKAKVLQCEAIAYHTARAKRKWKEPTHAKDEVKEFKQIGIKCSNSGVETIDFEACVDFAENFQNFEMAQAVAYQGQELVYKSKQIDAQSKIAEEKDQAKGALKGTKESIESQKSMYQQRSAIDAAKLAMLYNNYTDMPDRETVIVNCKDFQNTNEAGILGQQLKDSQCVDAINGPNSRFQVLQNQAMKDKMKAKMIKVATDMGSSLILAGLLGKQANDIDKALAKVDEFKPIDPFIVSEEEAQTTYCKQNPGDPKCLTGGLDQTVEGISDNVITFGGGATGTTYGNASTVVPNAIAAGTNTTSSGKQIDSMGKAVNGIGRDNSLDRASGASVKVGGTGSTGGGGGGPSGGGGGGGGGGGPAPQAPGEGGTQAAVQGATPKYGGGEGSLSMMGGFGINKAKGQAKDEGNPFGKLFDKDGAKNGGSVNFRDIASQKVGDKGDNIFQMISNRYSSVKADKRLLEYELAK